MPTEHHEVLIVGAGFSGIGTAIALRNAGFDDLLIVDDASGPGGVWFWNTYPGVAVDIPSFSYQFSFEQQLGWTRSYAHGDELKAYADRCIDKYELRRYLRFDTTVVAASFDRTSALWNIETSSGDFTARWLIHAGGPLSRPKLPDIAGMDTFAGRIMHTSRWDHDADLTDARIGVIGTGASAVQVIPEIAGTARNLVVFQRTPIWCLPKPDFAISRRTRTGLEKIPYAQRVLRAASQAYVEVTFPLLAQFGRHLPGRGYLQSMARRYLEMQVDDPDTRRALTPEYALGCKRPSFHNSYLSTFNQANVTLATSPIDAVTPHGVRTADGVEHELDVIVLATGFKVSERDALPTYKLTGPEGDDLGERWDTKGLQSYQGVSTTGFPNFFTIFGPYGYNGASFFTLIENSAAHIVRVMTEARVRARRTAEVREKAQSAYMAGVRRRQHHQVFWDPSCGKAHSYYFTRHGEAPFRPSTTIEASWRSRRFDKNHYHYSS